MSVLFLDHPEADFLAGALYLGLCEELGPEHVVDYPYKRSYHGEHHTYPSPYERDPGSTPWQSWSGGGSTGHTSPFAWMRAQSGREWSRDEVVSRIEEFGLAILASPRSWGLAALEDLRRATGWRMPPVVMVDGEDYEEIRWDLIERVQPKVYFKRELVPEPRAIWVLEERRVRQKQKELKILPLPFASPIPPRPSVPKDIDVLFLGGGTWPGRTEVCQALQRELGPRFVGGAGVTLSYEDYLDRIARARMAVSVRGHGRDTLRYWEIPSFDTLLVADRSPLLRPHPFEDGVHAALFDGPEELVRKVRRYLDDEDERQRVTNRGFLHLREHHTACARARQLLAESPRR